MLNVPAVPHLRTLAPSMVDTFILYLSGKSAYTMKSFAGLAMRGPGQLQNVTAVQQLGVDLCLLPLRHLFEVVALLLIDLNSW